jgi:putative nucleotidyltransferase with HDIG domain
MEIPKLMESVMKEMTDWHNDVLLTAPQTLKESMNQFMIESWARLIGLRDAETRNHSTRVTEMMTLFARAMGMTEENVRLARWGAQLHDIGKIGVPDSILQKPGPLTDEEWVVMKEHTSLAYQMLSPFPFLVGPALDIARHHHERWAGNGYPLGSRGEDIPLTARMFAIVDVYDSLRSDRPYRKAWSEEKTRAFLRTQSGTQFEPRLVAIFLKMLPPLDEAISKAFASEPTL